LWDGAQVAIFGACISSGSVVDIQSPTAEIRRGKKRKKEKKKETTGQKYNGLPYSTGQPYIALG